MRSLISIDFPAPEMVPESAHVVSAVSALAPMRRCSATQVLFDRAECRRQQPLASGHQKQPSKKEKGIDSGCRHEVTEAFVFFPQEWSILLNGSVLNVRLK